jgi:hypothetical protein
MAYSLAWNTVAYCPRLKLCFCRAIAVHPSLLPLLVLEPSVYQISAPFLLGLRPSFHTHLSGNLTERFVISMSWYQPIHRRSSLHGLGHACMSKTLLTWVSIDHYNLVCRFLLWPPHPAAVALEGVSGGLRLPL